MKMTAEVRLFQQQLAAPAPGPHLLITGGVHGDEFEPMAAIRQLRQRLADPGAEPTLLRGQVTLVPVVNVPAFQLGRRTADDGLDLARTCPGNPSGSITQRVACALSDLIRAADYYIDLHTGGTELAVLPMAGYMLHPDLTVLEQQRKMARAFNLPIVWGTSAALDGRSLSVARDAKVPAIYAEHFGSARCSEAGVEAYVDGCLNVMAWLGMIDRPTTSLVEQRVIEDPRSGSGHMQVCNPSPLSGFFEPAVRLGDVVQAGDLLGTVTDVLGDERHDIRSRESGIVLVLRTFPRVREGETVGVVLESNGAHR
jgi:predicted deacylase